MPEWAVVVVLGIIEGVTEFLPISSTGHLLMVQYWLHPRQSELFNVIVQCGAVLAVLLAFGERVKQLGRDWRQAATRAFVAKLGVAFLITGTGGFFLKQADFRLPENPEPVAWATLIGGVLILLVERWLRARPLKNEVTWPVAIAVGGSQLIALVFPGMSRSGTTILMALALGLNRSAATEFSFLLGIPTLLAAGGLELAFALTRAPRPEANHWGLLILGTSVAAVTAFAAVRWLLRFIQSHTFVGFGWYRIGLGLLILWLLG